VSTSIEEWRAAELGRAGNAGPSVPRRTILVLGSAAALALAIAAGVAVLLRVSYRPARVLPDGSRVVLEAVGFGTHHEAPAADWWQRLLAWRGSRPVGFSNQGAVFDTVKSGLVFWLSRRAAPGQTVMRGYCGVVIDEHGCWFEPTTQDWGYIPEPKRWRNLHQVGFEAFPRRGKSMTLALTDNDGARTLARFAVSNPAPGRYAEWPAAPGPPVSVTDGGLTFTLESLTHLNVHQHRREVAVLRVRRGEGEAPEWLPQVVTVMDATGNVQVSRLSRGYRLRGGHVRFNGLCRHEAAWKVRVRFRRASGGGGSEAPDVEFLVRP
jgi:hypothetical protein